MVSASYDATGTIYCIQAKKKKKSWGHYDMGYLYEKFVEQASETFFPRTHPTYGGRGRVAIAKTRGGRERHLCTCSYREKARG